MARKKSARVVTKARAKRVRRDDIDLTSERALAAELGVRVSSVAKAMEGLSPDERLAVVRRAAVRVNGRALGVESLPVVFTPEAYQAAVIFRFVDMILWTAPEPLDLRAELRRYIQALERIRNELPKGKRQPGRDVQIVLDMLAQGASIQAAFPKAITAEFYGKDYSEMTRPEKHEAQRELKKKVTSLKSIRKRRSGRKMDNTSPK
jgi:hypothetical protein